jgi:hypothetical protein
MTNEEQAELVGAFNAGWTGAFNPDDPTSPIARLRAAWGQATELERGVFKKEISGASPSFTPGELALMIAAAD